MSSEPEYPPLDPNVKRVLWRLAIIVVALVLGGIGAGLTHSVGPMIAAGCFSAIMFAFAIFAGTNNHRAARGLMVGLGVVIVANEMHEAAKRRQQSR